MPFVLTKLQIWLMGTAAVATAILAVLVYIGVLKHDLAAAKVQAQISADTATIAAGQTSVTEAAAKINDQGVQRDALTITVHQDNAHAIETAAGAGVRLDPGVNSAGRRGLCRYAAYAGNPSCARLFQDHPAVLPPGGGSDPAPGR